MTADTSLALRRLGSDGPRVSEIGLGLAALGRPGYINLGRGDDLGHDRSVDRMREATWSVLDAAWAAGVRYFDAARSYGRAEEFLAGWLDARAVPRDAVVGSKWGYVYTADWAVEADVHEVKLHGMDTLDRQWRETAAALGDRLALYQIHSATRESGVLDDPSVLGRLADLRESGVVVGASTSGPDQASTIRRIVDIEVDGERLFGAVQSTWNLLEPSAGDALGEAFDAGLGVIVKEAVANGMLTSHNRTLAARLEPDLDGWGLDTVAVAAALARPWASTVLSGAVTVDQLASNLDAPAVPVDTIGGLPDLAEDPESYWVRRGRQAWT